MLWIWAYSGSDMRAYFRGRDLTRDRKVIPKFSTTRKLELPSIMNTVIKHTVMFMTWWQETTNFQIQFLSFSQDESHPEIISTGPLRTSTSTRRSQHKRESLRLLTPTLSPDWQTSWLQCRIDRQPNNSPYAQSTQIPWHSMAKVRNSNSSKTYFTLWSRKWKLDQPEMTEQMKINHFHSLLRKNALQTFRNISSSNRQTLEDVLVIFRRKYVKPESQATAKHKWHRLVFDPNTMKLPDFLKELNQGAEKAFGDHAQKMIDSFLYAKLPPKLKRSVNMARLENGSYDEIVAHLERELELNALEESDDLPMATMTSSSTKPKTPLSTGQLSDITCNYCKEKGHMVKDCEKLKKKKEKDAQQGKSTQKKTYPECGTCGKKNQLEERCWQGAGAHLKPKRTRPEDSTDNKPNPKAQKPQTKPTSSGSQSSYSNDESKNQLRHDSNITN